MGSCITKPKDKNTKKPNWLDLPTDLTRNILQRLDTVDTLRASHVCTLWWNIYKDPLMWRTIRMCKIDDLDHIGVANLDKIARHVIDRSCGHLEDLEISYFGTDGLLNYLSERANHLLRLRLSQYNGGMSNKGMCEFVKKFSLLEELDISFDGSLEEIGQSCPLLKSLKLTRMMRPNNLNDAFAIAKTMPGLCHLTLVRIVLSNNRLLVILDGCPLLESLNMRKCHYFYLSESLKNRCLEQIKDLQLPKFRHVCRSHLPWPELE